MTADDAAWTINPTIKYGAGATAVQAANLNHAKNAKAPNSTTLISAVLGTPSEASRDADTLRLLSYGFSLYHPVVPVHAGQQLANPELDYRSEHLGLLARRAELFPEALARRGAEQGVDEGRDAGRGLDSNELVHDPPVPEGLDGGDPPDAVLGGERLIRVDVDLGELDVAVAVCDLTLEHGRERAARAAPRSPEVDDHGHLA